MKNSKVLKKIALLSSILLGISTSAYAATTATTSATVSVSAGALAITTPQASVDFGTITIDGTVQTITANLGTMAVEDLTGTGSGWNVTVQATQFTDGTNTLPTSILRLQGINTVSANGTTSPVPTVSGVAPYVLDGGSAQKILSAAINEGMGKYNVTFVNNALQLSVDTNSVINSASPYTSTITWSIVTGP